MKMHYYFCCHFQIRLHLNDTVSQPTQVRPLLYLVFQGDP
jgi:hypothetical protein